MILPNDKSFSSFNFQVARENAIAMREMRKQFQHHLHSNPIYGPFSNSVEFLFLILIQVYTRRGRRKHEVSNFVGSNLKGKNSFLRLYFECNGLIIGSSGKEVENVDKYLFALQVAFGKSHLLLRKVNAGHVLLSHHASVTPPSVLETIYLSLHFTSLQQEKTHRM